MRQWKTRLFLTKRKSYFLQDTERAAGNCCLLLHTTIIETARKCHCWIFLIVWNKSMFQCILWERRNSQLWQMFRFGFLGSRNISSNGNETRKNLLPACHLLKYVSVDMLCSIGTKTLWNDCHYISNRVYKRLKLLVLLKYVSVDRFCSIFNERVL